MPQNTHKNDRLFAVEYERQDDLPHSLVSIPHLYFLPALRTSGLLRRLSGLQTRLIVAILASVTSNGSLRATTHQIASMLDIPVPLASLSLWNLRRMRFRRRPIVRVVKLETGMTFYTLEPTLVARVVRNLWQAAPPPPDMQPAVVERNRSLYTRAREDVERDVFELLGNYEEEKGKSTTAKVWRALRSFRLERDDIQALIDRYGIERIARQLDWFPLRNVKHTARALVKTIIQDTARPKTLREILFGVGSAGQSNREPQTNFLVETREEADE